MRVIPRNKKSCQGDWIHQKDFLRETTLPDKEVAYLVFETFQEVELPLKERICSQREQILSFKSSPNESGANTSMSDLFPLEVYPFPLMWKH